VPVRPGGTRSAALEQPGISFVSAPSWRVRAATQFTCDKRSASGTRGMVVTNHPLASAAGAEMLASGGNAIDAAIASLFTLTVVEPMMVGIFGGGMAHIRLADGRHVVLDGLSTAPAATRPDSFRPVSDRLPDYQETAARENAIGAKAVAVPGTLKGWCEALARFGTVSLADAMAPAIRHASHGFAVTPYLTECITEVAGDLARDPVIAARYLPGGSPLAAGSRLVMGDYAETLRLIAAEGPAALYDGSLGRIVADHIEGAGGFLARADLAAYRTVEREAVRGTYRGYEILGPPPPSAGGVHVIQMLNILEAYDVGALGFGSPEALHLVAEALKIAFADRAWTTADPAFVNVPVDELIDKSYAASRRIDPALTQIWTPGIAPLAPAESPNTTHLTIADGDGNIVASTQTINSLFGARFMVPGTGIVPNNYMYLFDPHPGRTLSIAPGKRVTTSMAPLIALKEGKAVYALGLPGGLRIFGSAMQALLNLIDHGMSLQEAVEAPRLWTQGLTVEVEEGFPESVRAGLSERGHDVAVMPHVAGGMCAIQFDGDGTMTGAACWRADGMPLGLAGGLARKNVRFWPDRVGR
jgi:gamma-glutamyltranspeptidase / glutathione hydrolase